MHNHGIKKIFFYLTYHILPSLFWLCVILGFDTPCVAILTLVTALIHELGHIIAILYVSGKVTLPSTRLNGFKIKRRGILSYQKEILVLAAGPLINGLIFILCLPFINYLDGYIELFAIINFSTAASNLLLAEGYDGYGILYQVFEALQLPHAVLDAISLLTAVVLTFTSLYLIGKFGEGYWIFGVFFVMTGTKISKMVKINEF